MYLNPNGIVIPLGLLGIGVLFFWQKQTRRYFWFAFLIALLWTLFFRYEYIAENIFLFNRINLYPLVLWTLGLTLTPLVYENLPKRHRFALFLLLYWMLLWSVELFGQYALNVRLNADYPDLLGLGILHLPWFGQLFYVAVIPIFAVTMQMLDAIASGSGTRQ